VIKYAQAFPKSERARRGRKWQYIGEQQVKKFAYSPWTAKTGEPYTFYADVVLLYVLYPEKEEATDRITIDLMTGTLREFKLACRTGEVAKRIETLVEGRGGELSYVEGYWRNFGGLAERLARMEE